MDFLFAKGRTPFTFLDRDAIRIGALFERDLAHGEALTAFDMENLDAKLASVKPAAGHVEKVVQHRLQQTADQGPKE